MFSRPVQRQAARATATVAARATETTVGNAAMARIAHSIGTTLPVSAPGPDRPVASAMPPLQAVWVIRGGQWKWIDDHQRQQGDETPAEFAQRPELILPGGEQSAIPDAGGTMKVDQRGKPQTYAELAARRMAQGKELRARLLKNPKAIQGQIDELKGISGQLEAVAPKSLPDDHENKIASVLDTALTPAKFRKIIGGQDEFTQSSGTANFFNGLRTKTASETGEHDALLEQYAGHALRVMSGLRAPTQSIVAAIDDGGVVRGSQHPTTSDQPKLEHGGSGHTYNDQWRSQKQADVFDRANQDPDAPANAVFNAANFTGAIATLHGMSWPATASNVADINPKRSREQISERDMIKVQANVVGRTIGVTAPNDMQAEKAPLKPYLNRPTSPFRTSENSMLYAKTLGIALTSNAPMPQQNISSSSSSLSLSPPTFGGHSNFITPTPASSSSSLSLSPPTLGGHSNIIAPTALSSSSSHSLMPLFGAQAHILSDMQPPPPWDDAPDALYDDDAPERPKRPREDDAGEELPAPGLEHSDPYDARTYGMTEAEADAAVKKYLTPEWQ